MGDGPHVAQHSDVVALVKKVFAPHSALLIGFHSVKYLLRQKIWRLKYEMILILYFSGGSSRNVAQVLVRKDIRVTCL